MRAVSYAQASSNFHLDSVGKSSRVAQSKDGQFSTSLCCACKRRCRLQNRRLEVAGKQILGADLRAFTEGRIPADKRASGERRGAVVRATFAEPRGEPAPMGEQTQYKDSLLDRFAMNLFRRKMQSVTGTRTDKSGYDAFVDVSKALMRGKSAQEQQAAVSKVLLSLMPPHLPYIIRTFFKPTRLSLQLNAMFTPTIFSWLVGPAEVVDVEVNGVTQKTGVKIKKCRYLEASGCVGMCVNVCKVPTQDFFTKEFGLPLTMNPNFDDMSCEMVFGQVPPPIEEDKAFQQPCFATLCTMAAEDKPKCPKLLEKDDL